MTFYWPQGLFQSSSSHSIHFHFTSVPVRPGTDLRLILGLMEDGLGTDGRRPGTDGRQPGTNGRRPFEASNQLLYRSCTGFNPVLVYR